MPDIVPPIQSQLGPEQIHPTAGRVLLETAEAESSNLIWLPGVESRYPNMGFVVEAGRSLRGYNLQVNDLVLIKDEGHHTDEHTYYDAFAITLRDHKEMVKIIVESDKEVRFKEKIDSYRASPSNDFMISVMDVENQGWTFNASDVQDWGFEEFAHPAWRMEYMPTFMIDLNMGPGKPYKLHYIIDEKQILSVLNVEE